MWTSLCQQFRPQETFARPHDRQAVHLSCRRLRQVLHPSVVATQARQDPRSTTETDSPHRGSVGRRVGRRGRNGCGRVRRCRFDIGRRPPTTQAARRKTRSGACRAPATHKTRRRKRTVADSIRRDVNTKPETQWRRRRGRITSGLFEHRRLVCLSAGSSNFRFWRTRTDRCR